MTLGIRQDAGVFLFFQSLGLLVVPRYLGTFSRKKILLVALISFVYTASVVFCVMPVMGSEMHVGRFWGEYGNSWVEVFVSIFSSPVEVLKTIFEKSAIISFNSSFLFVPIFCPFLLVLSNLPGVILLISSAVDKSLLWYYHPSFLLPGLFLATIVGFLVLLRKAECSTHKGRLYGKPWVWLAAVFTFAAFPISIVIWKDTTLSSKFTFVSPVEPHCFIQPFKRITEANPGLNSVAVDFYNIVFVPNRYRKFQLGNYGKADLVFVPRTARWMEDVEAIKAIRGDPKLRRVEENDCLQIYIRKR